MPTEASSATGTGHNPMIKIVENPIDSTDEPSDTSEESEGDDDGMDQ